MYLHLTTYNPNLPTYVSTYLLTHPNSLRDSNVSPKLKTMEGQGVGARSLACSTIEG
jgi:hypothetical protein